jgi:hypothetical protein
MQVECEDKLLSEKVLSALGNCFFLKSNSTDSDSHHLNLKFKKNIDPFKSPENISELFTSPHLRVFKKGDSCYIVGEDSFFQLDLTASQGTGYLNHTFWDRPPKLQQEFLMLSVLWLFHRHGLFAIHGNALFKDGLSVLIAGDSGSGKSTTALGLIQKGWKYLSDDVTLINQSSQGIKALAFQKGFSFDPRLAKYYPEINKLLKSSSWNGQKRFLDITSIYPENHLSTCVPNILIFPKIVSEGKSQLIPIDKTSALIMLMQSSGGIMVDKEMAAQQVEVLKNLIYQTSSYRLLAGRDLYEEPEKISFMLSFK